MSASTDANEPWSDRTVSPGSVVRSIASDPLAQRLVVGQRRSFDAKEHIFRDGDAADQLYKVEAGNVCVYKLMSNGRRQIIDFAYPGDLIGLGALSEHAANAQAMTKTRLRCIPAAALRKLAGDDARLGIKLYEALSHQLVAARELLFAVRQRTASERVAAFLLALSKRNERNGEPPLEFVLPMTRNDIADFLGLTIETVSRMFSRFRLAGLIDIEQIVLIRIRDREALEALAAGPSE